MEVDNFDYEIDLCDSTNVEIIFNHFEIINDITKMFDRYNILLEGNSRYNEYMHTYLHIDNLDIKHLYSDNLVHIAFCIHCVIRGNILLEKLKLNWDDFYFIIRNVEFYHDSCFDKLQCYKKEILTDPDILALNGKIIKISNLQHFFVKDF